MKNEIMRLEKTLTAERIRELFDYDKESGVLTRSITTGSKSQAGDVVGWENSRGYLNVSIDRKKYKLHRVIWVHVYGYWPDATIDHINMVKTDNRLENLRLATKQENSWNIGKHKRNASGYKGVQLRKDANRWQATIGVGRKNKYLGLFATPELAYQAYCKAALEMRGEFARFE